MTAHCFSRQAQRVLSRSHSIRIQFQVNDSRSSAIRYFHNQSRLRDSNGEPSITFKDEEPPTSKKRNRRTLIVTTSILAFSGCVAYYLRSLGKNEAFDELQELLPINPALTLKQATSKLRKEEGAFSSVLSSEFHLNRVPSNSPVEDEYMSGDIQGKGSPSTCGRYEVWGVFDGHAGSAMSLVLRQNMKLQLEKAISDLQEAPGEPKGSPSFAASMVAAIKAAFIALDSDHLAASLASLSMSERKVPNALAEAIHAQVPFYAGSCALVCLHDRVSSMLYTACVGDSRAVLVRKDKNNQHIAKPLSEDQTGFSASEAKRVRDAHPGEDDCIDNKTGRLLGIAVTRAFGDHRWKLPLEAIETMRDKFFGPAPRPGYKTPPYMTAEPEVTVTKVEKGDVLILASDGLWDHMSNNAAAECIGRWMAKYRDKSDSTISEEPSQPHEFSGEAAWRVKSEYIVTEDDNAATHLIRNTLGGNRRELFTGVMSTMSPLSREARDDITVQVVFF